MIEKGSSYAVYRDLRRHLEALAAEGLSNPFFKLHENIRGTRARIEGQDCINFSSYNYLGLSGHPSVSRAAKEAIDQYGTSVSASRPSAGERTIHRELEQELARLVRTEDCITFVGGHATNVTTLGHLFGREDLILTDSLAHNSLLQGGLLSGASRRVFPHQDLQTLDRKLQEHRANHRQVLIVVEGIYSMDGDIPDLPRLLEIKRRHDALLMIDEAHSIGVLGENGGGIGEHFGIPASEVDLWMGTLSKSFASCGGYIAGSRALVEYLKYTAPGFLYSVGMTPQNAAAALAAVRLLREEPERVARLARRAGLFLELAQNAGLNTGTSSGVSVIPIIIGDPLQCIQLSHALFLRGISVQPMVYPVAPKDGSRLRFFLTCEHTEDEIRFAVDAVASELAEISLRPAAGASAEAGG